WHDESAVSPLVYLGYRLSLSKEQRIGHEVELIQKINAHCKLLSWRRLSIAGNSLLVNAVVLSRMWHQLRVTPIRSKCLQQIRRIAIDF
ncbi:hypothetical protein BC940DRAFT_228159, partial [Gongronella butleri]